MREDRKFCVSPALSAFCLVAAAALLGEAGLAQVPQGDLIVNGDFETDADGDNWPDGWPKHRGASVKRENGNTWLVLDANVSPGQVIGLEADWWKLKVTCRMKTTDVVLGDQGWKDARLAMNFVDENGKHVDPWPNVFHARGTTGWVEHERLFRIPAGAKSLHVNTSMFGASGRAEFDDIHVTVARMRSKMRENVPVPEGARDVWDMASAWRRKSATRESICLNDLWRFLPLWEEAGEQVPPANEGWGWFKVPGIWPRSMEGEAQGVLVSGHVEERLDLSKLDQAWYRREIVVPGGWSGRRILLDFTMVQTHARVVIDGESAGEVWFPGGRLDITGYTEPGKKHELALLVTARPLEKESQVFMAPDRIIKSKASVNLRGLTGDVFLVSEPKENALGDVNVITSTREERITLDTMVRNAGGGRFRLKAKVLDDGRTVKSFESDTFDRDDMKGGRTSFSASWPDPDLWDIDTPRNMYEVVVTLCRGGGEVLDESLPVRFGFREFWIDGRDFYLNGKRIHLRALLVRNINRDADLACAERSRQTCRRLKEYGFNFFITSNYHFKPGSVGYMDGLFTAADETGVLAAFSLPHIRDFRLDPENPETTGPYRGLTEWLIRRAQNHPSIVLYAMNHNATGYYGDQNPVRIDGVFRPEDRAYKGAYTRRIREEALMAAKMAKSIDPTRPVYHHQSGNLGDMHTVNIYLNWAPRQERSDWLEHWGTRGVKPLFFVEWGLPHVSSWSSYRGPAFIWRTEAYQRIWDSEYGAVYTGQAAYRMTETKVKSMAHEEDLWSGGKPFPWWRLIQHLRRQEENYFRMQAHFCDDNWRSHRTWGISSMLPWDQEGLWKNAPGRRDTPRDVEDRYANLQRPGIVPDLLRADSQYIQAVHADTIEPTVLGRSFLRWNMPLCAYIGGGPGGFTEKGHNFVPGETVRKQLVILNDTRRDATCEWSWKLAPGGQKASGSVTVAAGDKVFVPVTAPLPKGMEPGRHTLSARSHFGEGGVQEDSFSLDIMPPAECAVDFSRVALFDPKGMTAKLLDDLGVGYEKVGAGADLAGFDMLVIGREALTVGDPCPDISRVREGLKVLVFEQTYETLVNRLGFRANVHGMRRAFVRAPGHPALDGLEGRHLHDWGGAATLVPPHLKIQAVEKADPKWNWLGFSNTRVWRCGNRGCVASVLIEKPPRGSFVPLMDCGFDLQYAPLLEYFEGAGRVIFCQLDVTGRTEGDPAARTICANLVTYLDRAPSRLFRGVLYAGDARGSDLLKGLGVGFDRYTGQPLDGRALLVLGPGSWNVSGLDAALRKGLNVLCLGLGAEEIGKLQEGEVDVETRPTVPSLIERFTRAELAGVSNAELHWKTLLELAALKLPPEGSKEAKESNEALRVIERGPGRIVLCQAAPWMFDYEKKPYIRTTYRRNVFLVSRLLTNLGARLDSPLLAKFGGTPEVHDFPLPKAWRGHVDREETGKDRGWHGPDFDDSEWKPIEVPGAFDRQIPELADFDGIFWYRIRFRVPKGLAREGLRLHLGGIDDESWIWLNGKFLGEVTKKTNPKDYWNFPREYSMKPDVLHRDAENVLVVRCRDTYQTGGIMGTPRLSARGPWLRSYYVQEPESVDDPYRYYRW